MKVWRPLVLLGVSLFWGVRHLFPARHLLPAATASRLPPTEQANALVLVVLDDGPALVVAAFGADRVGGNRTAALWAVSDLASLHVIVGASLASTAV